MLDERAVMGLFLNPTQNLRHIAGRITAMACDKVGFNLQTWGEINFEIRLSYGVLHGKMSLKQLRIRRSNRRC